MKHMKNQKLTFSRIKHLCLMAGITLTFKIEASEGEDGKLSWCHVPMFKEHHGQGEFKINGKPAPKNPAEVEGAFVEDLMFSGKGISQIKRFADGKFSPSLKMGNA